MIMKSISCCLCTSTSTWSVLTVSCKTRSWGGHAVRSSSQTSSASGQWCNDKGRRRAPMAQPAGRPGSWRRLRRGPGWRLRLPTSSR